MLQFYLLHFEAVLGAECSDAAVHLKHPLATWNSATPGRLRVGFIHVWGVGGATFNPGEGTPGSHAEERVLLISRSFSETTLIDDREKLGSSPLDVGHKILFIPSVPLLWSWAPRVAALLPSASSGRSGHSSFVKSRMVRGLRQGLVTQ